MIDWCSEALDKIERCIDLVDGLVREYSKVMRSKDIPAGTKFNIYKTLMDLREIIVEVRMIIRENCSSKQFS